MSTKTNQFVHLDDYASTIHTEIAEPTLLLSSVTLNTPFVVHPKGGLNGTLSTNPPTVDAEADQWPPASVSRSEEIPTQHCCIHPFIFGPCNQSSPNTVDGVVHP